MAEERRAMEVEAGEIVMDGSDFEMPELSVEMPELSGDSRLFDVRSGGEALWPRLGSSSRTTTATTSALEDSACSKERDSSIPHDVLLAAEAAMPVDGNGNGAESEDANAMVEPDSDPSDESSDESDEDEDVNTADMQQSLIDGAEELDKMVKRAKEVDSDEEDDGATTEPPRTANEVTDLPPVPEIHAVLAPNQVPQQVGFVSSIMDQQVIVQAVEHEMVLNEGSILWLTEQRKPLGIVDEVFGPVKKPYYLVRYNKAADVPDVASQGVTVGFVQEFANFVLNDSELRKKGYDASGQHDEELSDDEEFSDDEEEEAERLRKQAAKQGLQVGDVGRGGGRGGGSRHKAGGRNSRGRGGGGRGRFSRSDSANMLEVDEATKARVAGRGHQRSNSLGSPVFSRDKGLGGEHRRQNSFSGQFHPSLERQNSWNRSPRSDVSYSQVPDLRSPYDRQSLPYQSPHHDLVRLLQQQPPHLSPQRSAGPPHWGPSGEVHQAPFLGPNVRWSHQATGDFQHPESMYQTRVNLVPYPLPQQMSMYAPPPQPVGTGVFIPPAQYTRNSQGNQMQQGQTKQSQMQQGQMHGGSVYPGLDGRAPPVGQWPVNGPSIVTGIPCYSNPPQPIFLQPGHIRPGMIAPGPNSNVYWTNNPGR